MEAKTKSEAKKKGTAKRAGAKPAKPSKGAERKSERHEEAPAAANDGHDHVMPVKALLGVWGALMVLTVVTVAIARVDLGQINVVVALAVAVTKATLVGLYFMHLKYDRGANRVVLVSALFFVVLFVAFVVFDTVQYQPSMIPPG